MNEPEGAPPKPKKTKSRWRRRVLYGLGGVALSIPALWIAIHTIPGFGPALADGVRAIAGPGPVAWAEDVAYGIQDRIDRWRYKDSAPKTFWEAPPPQSPPQKSAAPVVPVVVKTQPAPVTSSAPAASAAAPPPDPFPPPAYAPPTEGVAAEGD